MIFNVDYEIILTDVPVFKIQARYNQYDEEILITNDFTQTPMRELMDLAQTAYEEWVQSKQELEEEGN